MKELIKELWDEAAKSTTDDSWESQTAFVEKFAQLILDGAINAVKNTPKHCAFTTHDLVAVDCTIAKAVETLEQYKKDLL